MPVDQAVMHLSLERKFEIQINLVKSNTALPAAFYRCDISLKGAMLLGCNDTVMGRANSSCASTYYSMYNERFDLIPFMISCRVEAFRFF